MAVQPPAIIVASPQDGHLVQMIGLQANGPRAELDRLEAAAKEAGFPCKQMDSTDGHELLIAFPPGSDVAAAKRFIVGIQNGSFATLTFSSVLAPTLP